MCKSIAAVAGLYGDFVVRIANTGLCRRSIKRETVEVR